MKVDVYWQLWRMNAAFGQITQCLDALREHRGFHSAELARFRARSLEAQAATNSYLASVIETTETDQAGHRFRKRLAAERKDERGR